MGKITEWRTERDYGDGVLQSRLNILVDRRACFQFQWISRNSDLTLTSNWSKFYAQAAIAAVAMHMVINSQCRLHGRE